MARIRNTQGPAADQDFLDQAADMGADRVERYGLFRGYYEGDQGVRLSDRVRRFLDRNSLGFCENFCEPVIDAYVDRLAVTGFQTSLAEDGEPSELDEWLSGPLWERNRLDGVQGKAHLHATVKGDAFLIVDEVDESGVPRLVFNRPELVSVTYSDDDPDVVSLASKVWPAVVDGRPVTRLNVYRPDRVEKWFKVHRGKGGWVPFAEGVVAWLRPDGSPRGVPVFHFRHRALDGNYGRSELRSVVPQQDLLNKQVVDLSMVLDNYGEPQRWATGVARDNADLSHAIGDWFIVESKEANVGQFEIADATRLLAAIEQTLSRIARRSRTPLHLLVGGDMPSGEALKSAEAGLVAKVVAAQVPFGNVWEDAVLMAVGVAVDAGLVAAPPDGMTVECLWRNPESRSKLGDADAALKLHDLGVSRHTLIRELGYEPDEEEERRALEREAGLDVVASMMDRGQFADGDGAGSVGGAG